MDVTGESNVSFDVSLVGEQPLVQVFVVRNVLLRAKDAFTKADGQGSCGFWVS
jgi:hypothetical protein